METKVVRKQLLNRVQRNIRRHQEIRKIKRSARPNMNEGQPGY
jgi:hypothetical protein